MKKFILFFLSAALLGLSAAAQAETIKNKTFINTVYKNVKTIKVVQTVLDVDVTAADSPDHTSVKCHVNEMETNIEGYKIEARLVGSTLEIYQDGSKPLRGTTFRKSDGYIRIAVAQGVKVVVVNAVSGDVSASGLKMDNMEFSTVSGDTKASGCQAVTSLSFKSTSGDMGIGACSAPNFSAKSVSGDLKFDGLVSELAVITTTSGDISLKNCRGNKIDVKTVSGDVYGKSLPNGADFALVGVTSTSGDISLYLGEQVKQTAFKSVSGDISLYLKGNLKDNNYALGGVSSTISIAGVARASKKLELELGQGLVNIKANAVSGDISVANY